MPRIIWARQTSDEIFTTALNSLADGARVITGTQHDNSVEMDTFADFFLTVNFASAPTLGALVHLYIIRTYDNTDFEYGSASVAPNPRSRADSFRVLAQTGSHIVAINGIEIPPHQFDVILENDAGQAFGGTLNVLDMLKYSLDSQ